MDFTYLVVRDPDVKSVPMSEDLIREQQRWRNRFNDAILTVDALAEAWQGFDEEGRGAGRVRGEDMLHQARKVLNERDENLILNDEFGGWLEAFAKTERRWRKVTG